jgi:exodeoxyribonuclease VII large subunit
MLIYKDYLVTFKKNYYLYNMTKADIVSITDNYPEYTVTELSNLLKKTVEENFSYVRVKGEISGLKVAPSGHAYFSLKDNSSLISAVCWRGTISNLEFKPTEGVEVVCVGALTIYPGQSKYQIVVHAVQLAGIGSLMALLEKRKEQFAKEGLFLEEHKKPLPFLPKVIGIITSPTGSVIRDILHRITDRFPSRVLVWPVLVQGEHSAKQVADAIVGFNKITQLGNTPSPDVIIVARGGGSIEDLWSFNEEIVVRAAFSSVIPIISAVGHETDTTLLDFVADKRAPTPTAAAELVVPVRSQLIFTVNELGHRLYNKLNTYLVHLDTKLTSLSRGLPNLKLLIVNFMQKLDDLSIRLYESYPRYFKTLYDLIKNYESAIHVVKFNKDIERIQGVLDDFQKRLQYSLQVNFAAKLKDFESTTALFESYSYKNTLKRGFAIIKDQNNNIVKSISEMFSDRKFTVEVSDGIKSIKVIE